MVLALFSVNSVNYFQKSCAEKCVTLLQNPALIKLTKSLRGPGDTNYPCAFMSSGEDIRQALPLSTSSPPTLVAPG